MKKTDEETRARIVYMEKLKKEVDPFSRQWLALDNYIQGLIWCLFGEDATDEDLEFIEQA